MAFSNAPQKPDGVEPAKCHLESVPPEIRLHILHNLQLDSMQPLLRASPLFQSHYQYDQLQILIPELQGFEVEAWATYMSRRQVMKLPRSSDDIKAFLNLYKSYLSGVTSFPGLQSLPPEGLQWIKQFHLKIALPMSHQMARWALSNLAKAPFSRARLDEAIQGRFALTQNEQQRIFRGIYRHSTYQHLFGRNLRERTGIMSSEETSSIFLDSRPRWEMELVACVDKFVRDVHFCFLDDKHWNLENDMTYPSIFDWYQGLLDKEVARGQEALEYYLRSMASGGRLIRDASFELHIKRTKHVRFTTFPYYADNDATLDQTVQHLEFRSSATNEPDSTSADVPLSWTALKVRLRKLHHLNHKIVMDRARRGGYVFWDEERWENYSLEHLLKIEWLD